MKTVVTQAVYFQVVSLWKVMVKQMHVMENSEEQDRKKGNNL
jgi:hypothetical protein